MSFIKIVLPNHAIRCIVNNCIHKNLLQVRNSSYYSSPFLEDIGEHKIKYEVTKNPEDWKYVERALPPATVPEVTTKEEYPSGWKPQAEDAIKQPYFIERTKNHMIPVYLKIGQNGIRRHTYVRRIQGDIWLLEKELKGFLQKPHAKPIRSQVNEFAGYICINGDHVNAIKYWLEQRKF